MENQRRIELNKSLAVVLAVLMLITTTFAFFGTGAQADTVSAASGKVDASGGAYLRSKASTKSKAVTLLKDNTTLSISQEVFVKSGSTKATNRWYKVTASGKSGYIRSDLVDSVKYTETAGYATDALNYRTGPSTSMAKKGYFKKNASVTVVLNASLNGSSQKWYKVKVGSKYYFTCADWIKFGTASTTSASTKTTTTSTGNSTVKATAAAATVLPSTLPEVPVINTSDMTYPTTLLEGLKFGLSGKVVCDRPIESVKFGIINSAGKWIYNIKKEVNEETFNVSEVDASIRFGTLSAGTYTYRGYVYVEGKAYKVIDKKFYVKKASGGEKLAATAINLAWPYGTSKSTYKKKATAAYTAALNAVYPEHNKWSKGARTGASCDVFVGTVCRYSGIDPDMPRTVGKIWNYLPKHPEKWAKVNYTYKESDLRTGDIIIYYYKKGSSKHVCMYVKINGKGYLAEANYPSGYYGFINASKGKIFRSYDKKKFAVYRAVGGTSASIADVSDADL